MNTLNINQQECWNRIQNFQLDDPQATVKFSVKLAASQKWTAAVAERAIEEYKKFIFLCCISENGASPSKVVDEVWHLHLTYTKSYWVDFCKNTLGKDVHHHPSAGGEREDVKHQQWYADTLQLYEMTFGTAAPADTWPPPTTQGLSFTWPSIDQHTIIKAVAILALPFLFIIINYGKINPFALKGPQFLIFYPLFTIAMIFAAVLIYFNRQKKLRVMLDEQLTADISVFSMAYFEGGKPRAVQAGIIDLMGTDLLSLDEDKIFTVKRTPSLQELNSKNPLMEALSKENTGNRYSYDKIATSWCDEKAPGHPVLNGFAALAKTKAGFWDSFGWVAITISLGAARILQGLVNDQPVQYLLVEICLSLILSLVIATALRLRVSLREAVKKIFKQQLPVENSLRETTIRNFINSGPSAVTGFAEGAILASIFFLPQPARNNGGRESTSSSCGSSAGGGGGCSGGGGCGGCGGGD